eukprot:NODE_9801_length_306_cov_64.202335_g8033_i0.p4 GENE.NODE_9801_length_306_cov_64.202335_g8033_i0~~NODE_9801_length_306_cov_64.202335_g8033_i0.p4  ORF type:complete len:53 (-),score=2.62 NODE_9801_length_306_cov_64.202335_g8033_i0:4-162(-)
MKIGGYTEGYHRMGGTARCTHYGSRSSSDSKRHQASIDARHLYGAGPPCTLR